MKLLYGIDHIKAYDLITYLQKKKKSTVTTRQMKCNYQFAFWRSFHANSFICKNSSDWANSSTFSSKWLDVVHFCKIIIITILKNKKIIIEKEEEKKTPIIIMTLTRNYIQGSIKFHEIHEHQMHDYVL